jgi:hypothetical protein
VPSEVYFAGTKIEGKLIPNRARESAARENAD